MMNDEELKDAIVQLAFDGKVNCKDLLELAARTGVPPKKIGAMCNEVKIHIRNCQLGCFH